jgi:hypothetical protein
MRGPALRDIDLYDYVLSSDKCIIESLVGERGLGGGLTPSGPWSSTQKELNMNGIASFPFPRRGKAEIIGTVAY